MKNLFCGENLQGDKFQLQNLNFNSIQQNAKVIVIYR